ncbi:MAG TPA: tetratricopeptide repeat protein, partial [Ignavibacteriaceae bacterium]
KSTAKNPDDRYKQISEMYSDLLALKGNSGSGIMQSRIISKPGGGTKIKRWIWPGAAFIIVLLIAGWFYFTKNSGEKAEPENMRKMIVVLPFENLGSKDDNYFADGVTEEITSKLASNGNIGVISRNSAEKLANSDKSTSEIGKELGVDYILSGTIRWAKGSDKISRVRITPQLTRVSDNTITWSDSYDKILDDIFSVQNDIAQKVVDQLGGSLASEQIEKNAPTENLEAYDFYLRGLSYENRGSFSKSDISNSINLYKKALKLDPKFALAYAHLSKSQASLFWFYFDRTEENVNTAYDNAKKSYELDPDLAEAHLALGYYHYWCRLEYDKAIQEFTRALKIQPNNAEAYFGLGIVYRRMGNFNLSIQNNLKSVSLDPLSIEYSRNLGETYSLVKEFNNSVKTYNKVIELSPDLGLAKAELAQNYIFWKGDTKTAKQILSGINDDNYLDVMINLPVYIDILDRDYDNALKVLKSSARPYETGQFRYTPKYLMLGLIYKYKNEPALSKTYFDSSRTELEKMLKETPMDERLHSSLGITYAGLGLNDKAVYEGKKGIEILPLEKEAYKGFYRQWDIAIIYTLIGDYNNALKQIDFILSIPGAFTISILKKDPLYDPLRNLPGYKAVIQKYTVEQ